MRYILYFVLVALPSETFALDWPSLFSKSDNKKQVEQKNDPKADTYFSACRTSSLKTLLNIVKDAKAKYKELDDFSLEKCTKLKNLGDNTSIWSTMKDSKFEGCVTGVDAAIGMNPADDELRKKFKMELCL